MCRTDTGQVWGPHARFRRSDTWVVGSSSALCCEVLSRRLTSDLLLLEASPASAAFSGFVAAAVPKLGVDLFAHLFTLPPPGAGVCRSASCDFPRRGSPGAMASMEQTQSLKRVGVVSRWAPAAVGLLVWGRPDPPPPAGATSHTGQAWGEPGAPTDPRAQPRWPSASGPVFRAVPCCPEPSSPASWTCTSPFPFLPGTSELLNQWVLGLPPGLVETPNLGATGCTPGRPPNAIIGLQMPPFRQEELGPGVGVGRWVS